MKFNIDQEKVQAQITEAKRVLNKLYNGQMPKQDMVCIVTATKGNARARNISYGFSFEFTKNNPEIGQVVENDDYSFSKIVEIIK